MNIIISNSSDVPIYEQIKIAIKRAINTGVLRENEILPSIRSLAQDLRISVMTVKKTYDELEQEGFIKTVHGKGSFVLPQNLELLREEKLREIEGHLQSAIDIAKSTNISKKEIVEVLNYLYEEEQNGKCTRN